MIKIDQYVVLHRTAIGINPKNSLCSMLSGEQTGSTISLAMSECACEIMLGTCPKMTYPASVFVQIGRYYVFIAAICSIIFNHIGYLSATEIVDFRNRHEIEHPS